MSRLKPHQIVLATGVGAGLVFAGSGIAPSVLKWHDESPVGREVFGDPGADLLAEGDSPKVVRYVTAKRPSSTN